MDRCTKCFDFLADKVLIISKYYNTLQREQRPRCIVAVCSTLLVQSKRPFPITAVSPCKAATQSDSTHWDLLHAVLALTREVSVVKKADKRIGAAALSSFIW